MKKILTHFLFVLLFSLPAMLSAQITGVYSVNMFDSFGDGWNGASLTIAGAAAGNGNFTVAGATNSVNFTAAQGNVITFTWAAAGSFPGECSFEIESPSGLIIFEEFNSNPIGLVYTLTIPTFGSDDCIYVVEMADSFGDGWNGAVLNISIDGAPNVPFTFASGFGAFGFIAATNGGTMNLTFSGGSFPGECSYTIYDPAGAVFFSDPAPPVIGALPTLSTYCGCEIACPPDLVYDLGPGECSVQVSYNVEASGTCLEVFEVLSEGFDVANWTFSNVPGNVGGSIDLTNAPTSVSITSGNVGVGGNSLYSTVVTTTGAINFDWDFNTGDAGFEDFGYSVNGATTFLATGAFVASGSESVNVSAGDVFAFVQNTLDGGFGSSTTEISNLQIGQNIIDVDISGPESGDLVEAGVYTVEACATDAVSGEPLCCEFTITVNAYGGPVLSSLACNDLVQVSLDENCQAAIGADQILEGGPYACYDDYLVYVDQYGFGNNINGEYLSFSFGLHNVTVTDPNTGNSCWGQILIEDKLPPTIECVDYTLACGQSLEPVFTPPIGGVNHCQAFPGLPIGPNAGTITTSTCEVNLPQGVEIVDVNVCVDITHTFIGDCYVQLISPGGKVTDCWGFGQCGGTDNMFQKFDDSGPQIVFCVDINNGCGFTLQPVATQLGTPSLTQYISDNPNGTWTLMITDIFNADEGTLDFWDLEITYKQNAPFAPVVDDNCDNNVDLEYSDQEFGDLCDGTLEVRRTWTATDDAGASTQCVQILSIEALSLAGLDCPDNYEGDCGEDYAPADLPEGYDWPTVDGVPVVEGGICNIFVGYWDKPLSDCGNGSKIIRTWTILDWCTQEVEECIQVIKLADNEGPWLDCPDDYTVGSDPWFCNADVVLQVPYAEDHCGTPFTLTPSVEGNAGTLIHFGGNFWRVDNLPVGEHTITWTAVDDCDNESSCSYDVTVVDNVPPVPICDEHTIVSLTFDNGLDHGLTKIYAPTFDDGSHDNCGPVTFLVRRMPPSCIDFDWIGHAPNYPEYPNNDGGLPESVDQGLTFQPWVPFACCDVGETVMVELRVTDIYGNINSCMVEVEVQDKLPPLIVCPPDITVSCDFWFDAHETDGFEPTDGLEDVFGRVLDAYDYDESDREYVIVDDPGNPYLPQPYHWGLDGWADDNCDIDVDVRTRLFDDCSGNDLPGGAPEWAVRLVERTFRAQDAQGNTSTCRQRIWVVDYDPFYIEDTQCGLNNADDVRWPCDLVLTDCPEGELTPENLSQYAPNNRPVVYDDNCSIIGVTYEDQIFYFVDNACYKIVRTWTVIDWCQFESDGEGGHYGYWTYVQVIKVHDNDGAEFLDCPDGPLTYCVEDPNVELPSNNQVFLGESDPNSSSCSVHVWESRTVYETCSDLVIYDVKIYPFNGDEYVQIVAKTTVPVDTNGEAVLTWDTRQNSLPSNHSIRRYGLPYNDRYCSNWPLSGGVKDYHRVLWSVEDGCGNLSTCEYLFRLEDCKKPTPICVGLSSVVMPTTGAVTIWAKDFDSGSSVDDCTAHEDLLFSFSGTTYQPSRVFDCEAIEENGSPSFLVEIWVVDEGNDQNCNGFIQPLGIEYGERNKDFCTTFIVIDDNEGVCGDGAGGVVETEEDETVELVRVTMTDPGNGNVLQTFLTTGNGLYHFTNPLMGAELTSERNDDHKNGVSTLDLVKIQKHLLGIQLLDSPYKLIAADANNSESVSALDLVEIRKLILGLYTEFPKNDSWRFVNSSFEFADPSHPWPFNEIVDVQALSMGHDFVGVKVGDVNGNVVANATQVQVRNAKGVLEFNTDAQVVVAGQTVTVPVSAKNFAQILGYQFTMKTTGLSLTSVEAGTLDMTSENIGIHEGAITVSWNKVSPVSSSDILFTLTFTATESGDLSEMLSVDNNTRLTDAEAYNGKEETLDVALNFRNQVVGAGKEFALFQNEPNPFEGSTVIGFTLPEAMDATVTVYDVTGKVVHMIEGSYAQGYNEIKVNRKDLVSAGVMYYRLDANDFTATKKMVVID